MAILTLVITIEVSIVTTYVQVGGWEGESLPHPHAALPAAPPTLRTPLPMHCAALR